MGLESAADQQMSLHKQSTEQSIVPQKQLNAAQQQDLEFY